MFILSLGLFLTGAHATSNQQNDTLQQHMQTFAHNKHGNLKVKSQKQGQYQKRKNQKKYAVSKIQPTIVRKSQLPLARHDLPQLLRRTMSEMRTFWLCS